MKAISIIASRIKIVKLNPGGSATKRGGNTPNPGGRCVSG
jgi:hypothetical protein